MTNLKLPGFIKTATFLLVLFAVSNRISAQYVSKLVAIDSVKNLLNVKQSSAVDDTVWLSKRLPYPVFKLIQTDVDGDGCDEFMIGVIKKTLLDTFVRRRINIWKIENNAIVPMWLGSKMAHPLYDFEVNVLQNRCKVLTIEYEFSGLFSVNEYVWHSFGLKFIRYIKREITLAEAKLLIEAPMNLISKLTIGVVLLLFSKTALCIDPEQLLHLDYTKNYKSYQVNELRLIRSMVYAHYGFLFEESDLRDYFMKNYKWYETLVWKRAELGWQGQQVPDIKLTEQEQTFVDRIDKLIAEKCKGNYYQKDSIKLPELKHIANRFDETDFPERFKKILKENGFVVKKDTLEQLFHLYDRNRYEDMPGFVTTDLFLQLFHTYFSYTLKDLEKEQMVGLVTNLTNALYNESLKYTVGQKPEIIEMANFNACFFAIAYTLITNKKLSVPKAIVGQYVNELNKIERQEDYYSSMFKSPVPYSLFIPRGHYTRTEEQKRYFKTMMWLQIAPFCLSNNELLRNACFNAFMLKNGKDIVNQPIRNTYNAIYDPIAFLVGDADNISVTDICDVYDKYSINNINLLADPKIINVVAMKLREIVRTKDQIQPKIKLSCGTKINFMPQRYLVDNDILQQFVDTARGAEKAFPKGLEVLNAFGLPAAKNLLYNYYHENKTWKPYDSVMQQQIEKFSTFDDWNKTLYNKWLQSLIKLNKPNKTYPSFMQTRGWQLKNLNTSLASWAELKHDVILYGEQPEVAEMGGGGDELPPPVTVGYVEPNLEFWNTCKELMNKNELFLKKYNLMNDELKEKTAKIKSFLEFFITASKKEINGETLTKEEYSTIENIGGEFDYLSLSMINPYVNYSYWDEVKGPDKTIAVIADVYTRNVPGCPKNGILHEGNGLGNVIYVVVEINGLLYLTRGATFTYYEFPFDGRLTDEAWIELLRKHETRPVSWMDELTE